MALLSHGLVVTVEIFLAFVLIKGWKKGRGRRKRRIRTNLYYSTLIVLTLFILAFMASYTAASSKGLNPIRAAVTALEWSEGVVFIILAGVILYRYCPKERTSGNLEIMEEEETDKKGFPFVRTAIAWVIMIAIICIVWPQIPSRLITTIRLWAP